VKAGVASFRIRNLDENDVFEVDTPNAAVTFERPGTYRVDVDPNGNTRVLVRGGLADVAAGVAPAVAVGGKPGVTRGRPGPRGVGEPTGVRVRGTLVAFGSRVGVGVAARGVAACVAVAAGGLGGAGATWTGTGGTVGLAVGLTCMGGLVGRGVVGAVAPTVAGVGTSAVASVLMVGMGVAASARRPEEARAANPRQ
jgi:hypothetical protein